MTVLVTGGAGYIGSHTVLALRQGKEEVVVVDNLSTGTRERVPADVEFYELDAGNRLGIDHVIKTHKVDAILHFAASIRVEESVEKPLLYYRNNVEVTRALLESAVEGGVKNFVFSSSAAVYGNPARVPVDETAPCNPLSPYGHSKLMAEQILKDVWKAADLNSIALRYFNVAGADPEGRAGYALEGQPSHLIRTALAVAMGRKDKLTVFGADYPTPDGTCVRDYIHVSDLAQAHVEALAYLRNGGTLQTLNCGYGKGYSVLEVIEATKEVMGKDFPIAFGRRREGDPMSIIADVQRIKAMLPNWKPQFENLPDMIRHQCKWEQSQQPVA